MKRKVLAVLIAIMFVFMCFPLTAIASDAAVYVNGINLTGGGYWKNGDTTVPTGTAEDYNAYFNSQASTLVLKNAEITSGYYDSKNDVFAGIYANVENFAIVLGGENKIDLSSSSKTNVYGVYSKKNVTLREGLLDIKIKSDKIDIATGIFSGKDVSSSFANTNIDLHSKVMSTGIYASRVVMAFNESEIKVNAVAGKAGSVGVNAEIINLSNGEYNFTTDTYGLTSRKNLILNDCNATVNVSPKHGKAYGVKFASQLDMSFEAVLYSKVSGDYYAVSADNNAECIVGGIVLPIGGKFDTVKGLKTVVDKGGKIANEAKLTAELCNAAIATDPTVVELELGCDPVEVTVKNVGNVDLELIQPTSVNYKVGELSKTRLALGETAVFTIAPIKDENSFEYIEIKTNYGTTTKVQVSYTVIDDHTPDHAGDKYENTELPTDSDTKTTTKTNTDTNANENVNADSSTESGVSSSEIVNNNTNSGDKATTTGVRHQWILPVVLICIAAVIVVVLIVTKKKTK